ncbi:MAG: 2-C-methyl-D-erythritol 4-phosphate cytidylyltransferase [Lachnospiraceae bacterium]|nr:2-C-methyl-D-erythritol 4-phosphate cytidylyltransferase [Lachnospiraceae bacterium]
MKKCGAIILAAGSGKRMKTEIPKQFLELAGVPLFLHSVRAFSGVVDEIVLVTGEESVSYCRSILEKEMVGIPVTVTAGGKERYHSSMNGLKLAKDWEYVMIHDAARACISEAVIRSSLESAVRHGSGVAAVLAKDTIKAADENGCVTETLDRGRLRIIQTPQCFYTDWIVQAYAAMEAEGDDLSKVTDDAMVLETYGKKPVYLSEGSYENIKVTTPEDLLFAGAILQKRGAQQRMSL